VKKFLESPYQETRDVDIATITGCPNRQPRFVSAERKVHPQSGRGNAQCVPA
jgi:hypothetical protein